MKLMKENKKYRRNFWVLAKSGSRSDDMLTQAEHLIHRLQNNSICDWKNDWKLITIFVGVSQISINLLILKIRFIFQANDLCHFCDNSDENSSTPEQYQENIRVALDKLYNASIPRTLINLVLPPDVRGFKEYTNNNSICQTFLQNICPCAAFPTTEQAKKLDDYILRYQELLENLTNSGRYDGRDDFTVVIQPFMAKTQLPIQDNRTIDFSYLSPDCFHFSGEYLFFSTHTHKTNNNRLIIF
jgi:phospholipase B1